MLLAIGFKQTRLLLLSLHLAATTALLHQIGTRGLDNPAGYVALVAVGFSWPLLQHWILLRPTCNIWSRTGFIRSSLILAPYAVLTLLLLYQPARLAVQLPALPTAFIEFMFAGTTISPAIFWWQSALLASSLILGLLYRRDETDIFLSLNLIMLLTLAVAANPIQSTLYHLLGQALLLISLIRHGYAMAFVDTLTNIPGRRALEHYLINPGRAYSVAMLDIDHFKQFNDRYGHDIGDQVLRMVATQLSTVTAGGRVFRYGGEEFTVVFKRRSQEDAHAALEQLRERIANYPLKIRQQDRPNDDQQGQSLRSQSGRDTEGVRVTISIGLCRHSNEPTPEQVIKKADEALYSAKRAGRNCTRISGEKAGIKKGRSRNDFARNHE